MASSRTSAILTVLLLLVSLVNVTYMLRLYHQHGRADYSWHGSDYPQELPVYRGQKAKMTMQESAVYPLLGYDSDEIWTTIASKSIGYARFGPDDRLLLPSMFHDLHCLRMLNSAFGHASPGWAHIHHVRHCLGYLRTSILCRPDLTLEPGDFTQRDFDVDWVGETHTCRDHSVIYDFLDKNFDDWEARTEVGPASGTEY
ncbi:hypothetical protein GGG16DRAFT_94826 [Schizophyllum commune]